MWTRVHVATLGFYANEMVEYVLLKRAVDKVILVYTEENKNKFEMLRNELEGEGMPVIPCKVAAWRFELILATILEEITKHTDSVFEFHASCGTRVMAAAIQMAALLTESSIFFVERGEGRSFGGVVELKPAALELLTERKRDVLQGIQKLGEKITQIELIQELGIKRSGLSKHLKELRESGFVSVEDQSRPKRYSVTHLGRIIVSLKEFRKMTIWGR